MLTAWEITVASAMAIAEKTICLVVIFDIKKPPFPRPHIAKVKEGKISEKEIDRAVRNILKLKFELGLFENPYVDKEASAKVDYSAEHLAAAKEAAVQSAILLQNNNNVLPLEKTKTILVTGPLADAPYEQMGTWAFDGQKEHTVTPLQALRKEYNVIWEPGLKYSRDKDKSSFAKVRAAAAKAEAAVVFVGEEAILSGEAHSLSDLNLQGAQSELIAEVKKAGKPVVVVVMAGRPLTIERDLANCDAMLYSYHPGTMGGPALADLIKGKAVPSGKLPMTFPMNYLDIPSSANFPYNHKESSGSRNSFRGGQRQRKNIDYTEYAEGIYVGYRYFQTAGVPVSYPFGHGKSYTTFEYSKPVVKAAANGFTATINVRNTGKHAGKETVQLYVSAPAGGVEKPAYELKGFAKTKELAPGESQTLTIAVDTYTLAHFNEATSAWETAAGTYKVMFGADAADIRTVSDYKVKKAQSWKVNNVLAPAQPINELSLQE